MHCQAQQAPSHALPCDSLPYRQISSPIGLQRWLRVRTTLRSLSGTDGQARRANAEGWVEMGDHDDVVQQQDRMGSLDEACYLNDLQMLSALENRNTDEAWRIYELMIKKTRLPSSVCLSRLVCQLSYSGTPSSLTKAQRLLALVQKRKSEFLLDSNSLGLLAMATSKGGAVRYASSVLRLMIKLGYYPHVKAWSAVISKLGKDREEVPVALSLFDDICVLVQKADHDFDSNQGTCQGPEFAAYASSSIRPDTGAFNAALNACANARLVDKAHEIFDRLGEFDLKPDVLTFNIMIKLYALSNNKEKLSQVLFEMEEAGVKPCLSTMHSLVAAYVGLDELDRAVMLVEALREGKGDVNSILTNDITYLNTSKSIPAVSLDAQDSIQVTDSLPASKDTIRSGSSVKALLPFFPNFKPDTRMYTILMKGYMQKGRLDDVKQLLVAMQNHGDMGSLPNEVTYTTVITTCVQQGLLNEARSFLLEMSRHKVPSNVVTYNVLMKGYCATDQVGKGRLLLEDMRRAGVQPDVVSFNTLIDGYIRIGDSTSALAMYTQMREAGIPPSKQSYTNLIKAFGKSEQPGVAEKIFQEMQHDQRVKVDTIAWNALIDSYSRAGHIEGAKGAFQRMKESDHLPTVATYGSLLKGFALKGKAGEALVLWNEIQERLETKESNCASLIPDSGLLDGLVDICVRAGFFLKALEILACMEKHQIPADKIKYQRMFIDLHSKLYTSPHTSQARRDGTADRRRAVEAFKFWIGLPNTYYGRDWSP